MATTMNQIATDDLLVGIVQVDMVGKLVTFRDLKGTIELDVTDYVSLEAVGLSSYGFDSSLHPDNVSCRL